MSYTGKNVSTTLYDTYSQDDVEALISDTQTYTNYVDVADNYTIVLPYTSGVQWASQTLTYEPQKENSTVICLLTANISLQHTGSDNDTFVTFTAVSTQADGATVIESIGNPTTVDDISLGFINHPTWLTQYEELQRNGVASKASDGNYYVRLYANNVDATSTNEVTLITRYISALFIEAY